MFADNSLVISVAKYLCRDLAIDQAAPYKAGLVTQNAITLGKPADEEYGVPANTLQV